MSLAAADAFVTFGSFATAADSDMCQAVVTSFGGGPDVMCAIDVPNGEYERSLRSTTSRFLAEIAPRIGGMQPSFTDDEVFTYLDAIQPPVEQVLTEIITEIDRLDPPEQWREDHDAVDAFFRDLLDVAERITVASRDRDIDQLERLFTESGQPMRSLATAVSDDGRELVGFLLPSRRPGCETPRSFARRSR